jgi:cellulose synthase/poly-beta-1,6-N-acetylglucosamine synthase-like glycosyltransferase
MDTPSRCSFSETIIAALFWFSLFEVVYSYVLYPWLLRILAGRYGRPARSSDDYFPSVAVVIPARNEEKVLAGKLSNIFASDYPPDKLTVWIGSDMSTDRTEEIARQFGDARVKVWRPPERCGKAGILNRVIPMAEAEIVLLTDADIMLDAGSIRMLTRHFADPEVGGVGGITLQRSAIRAGGQPAANEEAFYRGYEAAQKTLESRLHSTISAFGSFYAIRRRLFVPLPRNTYSNDDVMTPMNIIRQGYRMYFEPAALSYEEIVPHMTIEFNRRVRIGAGNYQAFFRLLDFLNPLRGWPFFCYVSHKVTRWFSPLFIALAGISCVALSCLSNAPVYRALSVVGVAGVLAGLLHKAIPVRAARRLYYFMAMNVALFCGFFRFLGGIRSATWSRTIRPGDEIAP